MVMVTTNAGERESEVEKRTEGEETKIKEERTENWTRTMTRTRRWAMLM